MSTPVETVRSFYAALTSGKPGKAVALMATNAEWVTAHAMEKADDGFQSVSDFVAQALKGQFSSSWMFKMNGRGPHEIHEYVLSPLLEKGTRFVPSTAEFKIEDDRIAWLGNFANGNNPGGGLSDSAYAHVFRIRGEKITQILQIFYTFPVLEGRVQ